MDFVRYAERGARLLNAEVSTPDDLRDFLADRDWLAAQVGEKDVNVVRRFQRDLRPAFEAAQTGEDALVVERLNVLLEKHPVTPYIAGSDQASWHLHVSNKSSSATELLVAEALLGLAVLACDLGTGRLGVCEGSGCEDVYVDTSPNSSRRYCSDRCSSRANVAAYRARQKAEAAIGELA